MAVGLTSEEVRKRERAGQVNFNENPNTRTYKQIVRENTMTFFNFLNIVLFVMIILVGSFRNAFFIGTALINTVIGILQEIRAKRTLDKLAVLTTSKARPIRDGVVRTIEVEKLVLDDTIVLKAGDQIPADCQVVKGSLEVNESLLTGESDTIVKETGAELFSGSFVTSGQAQCRVTHVGKDNYTAKLTSEAKDYKEHDSELRNAINLILKVISIVIVPLGAGVFYKQFFISNDTFRNAVVGMVTAVLGMIPEGLVLLTSVALTVGTITLARRKTLVQELYCIETLAHVDTLCLDKTGTITSGEMCVERVLALQGATSITMENGELQAPTLEVPDVKTMVPPPHPEVLKAQEDEWGEEREGEAKELDRPMGNILGALQDDNATFQALKNYFPAQNDFALDHAIPFSSDRKYSGAAFSGRGTYLMGAVQFLFPRGNAKLVQRAEEYAKSGYRVLILAHSPSINRGAELPGGLKAIGMILITDVIRHEAPKTLAYFRKQGVHIKVISGDDPVTVAAIAKKAGLKGYKRYVDATKIKSKSDMVKAVSKYSVFGRVTPAQKKEMVQELKRQGHTVAMTGDGVNDVLALKEADCSIAMASGSDAAKNIANVVLLDSNFASMPEIVNQGRKVVNNIRRAASMFLIKTIFSAFLSLLLIFFGEAYPFEAIQMSLISACAVGIPTFFLANLDPDYSPIDHTFLRHVLIKAVPTALTITLCVFSIMQVCINVYHDNAMLSTACVLVTGWSYMAALKTIYAPMNLFRTIVVYGMNIIFFVAAVILQNLLSLGSLEFGMIIQVFILMTISPVIIEFLTGIFVRTQAWLEARAEQRKRYES